MNNKSPTQTLLRRSWMWIVLVGLLQGCGGGGGGGGGGDPTPPVTVPDAVPTGYYDITGSASVFAGAGNTQLSITDLQGMIYNGRLIMLSATHGLSYDGTITVTGNSYTGTVTAYDDGTFVGIAPVTGTIVQGSTVTGTLAGTGAGSGSFTLNYAANNGEAADLQVVGKGSAQIWNGSIGASTFGFVRIATTGNVGAGMAAAGGAFDGCNANGGVIAPISGTHLYTVTLTLTSCANTPPNADGTYTGFATTRTDNLATPDDRLIFVVTNGAYSPSDEFSQ